MMGIKVSANFMTSKRSDFQLGESSRKLAHFSLHHFPLYSKSQNDGRIYHQTVDNKNGL